MVSSTFLGHRLEIVVTVFYDKFHLIKPLLRYNSEIKTRIGIALFGYCFCYIGMAENSLYNREWI